MKSALKASPTSGAGCNSDRACGNSSSLNSYNEPLEDEDDDEYENDVPHVWRQSCVLGSSACCSIGTPKIGCHFSSFVPHSRTTADRQGTFYQPPNPGLKPWAVLCSRFATKSDVPTGRIF